MFNSPSYSKWQRLLAQLLPDKCQSRLLNFAYLIVGMLQTQSVYLSVIARSLPIRAKKRSLTKRLERLLDNEAIDVRGWYHSWAEWLIQSASVDGTLHLTVDTTKVSAYSRLLMISVAYQRRTLPLIWDWVGHPRGHCSAQQQIQLLDDLKAMLPDDVQVTFVGDSEFGSVDVLEWLKDAQWHYALRQKGRTLYRTSDSDEWQRLDSLATHSGQAICLTDIYLTESDACLTNLVVYWKQGEKDPWYLATNQVSTHFTYQLYKRRMWIEEMFGDMKGHGFDLELTRLRTPERLSRLTLAVSILYLWLIATGEYVLKHGLQTEVDRNDRRDLSIFRTGWDWLERRFALHDPIPIRLRPDCSLVSGC